MDRTRSNGMDRTGATRGAERAAEAVVDLRVLLAALVWAALAAVSISAPAASQDLGDVGWSPWAGCWEVLGGPAGEDGAVTCIRPLEGFGSAELVNYSGEDMEASEPEILQADGQARSAEQEGCTGRDRAGFSRDGGRVYLSSEFTCPGGLQRTSTWIFAMVTPFEWLDVRAVETGDDVRTWTRRYRRLDTEDLEEAGLGDWARNDDLANETARYFVSDAVSVDDVIEASERVHPDAVKAWIAEEGDPIPVDAESLLRMAEAGVPGEVTDLVVAVSFPDRFVVGSDGSLDEADRFGYRDGRYRAPRRVVGGVGVYRGWGGFYSRSHYYGGSPYDRYYTPWGYGGYGWGWGYAYRPSVVYVQPRSPAEAGGRIVNGRGWTRSGGSDARPSGSGSSPSPSSTRGGGDRGTVSPSGGYRGGSSSGNTGRRARPRDDGDN